MGFERPSYAPTFSDEWLWDVTTFAFGKLYRNSPFNPMSWKRLVGSWVLGYEEDKSDLWDYAAHAVWISPAPLAALFYPEYTFGFARSAIAVTSGLTVPVMAPSAGFSSASLPLLFAGGLLNTARQVPGIVGYSPQPDFM
jgi:hypothetical protein